MRKISFMAMMLMALSLPMTMVSCGDDDEPATEQGGNPGGGGEDGEDDGDDGTPGGGEETPGGDVSAEAIDTLKQKQVLEATANEIMSKISATDFEEVVDLFEYVESATSDGSEVERWFDYCVSLCEGKPADDVISNIYVMSNFYGQFELRGGRWVQTASNVNYIEFNFTAGNGDPCSLRLTCSGTDFPIHIDEYDEESPFEVNHTGSTRSYTQRVENTYVLPERINIRLAKDGRFLAEADIESRVDLNRPDGYFDYKDADVDLSIAVTAGNYRWAVDRVAYSAGRTAAYEESLSVAGETLVSLKAEASGDITNEADPNGDITTLELAILDRVKVGGQIDDVAAFSRYIEDANGNDHNEAAFKENIDNANRLMNIGVYFDGSSTPSASLKLYPFASYGYYGERWSAQLVLAFPDGTSYSTFGSFFSQEAFQGVIDRFTELAGDFVGLVNPGAGVDW